MLAIENDCCWIATLVASAFGLQPSSINAKIFSICFHVLCSNNSTYMEIMTNHLSAKCKEACWPKLPSLRQETALSKPRCLLAKGFPLEVR